MPAAKNIESQRSGKCENFVEDIFNGICEKMFDFVFRNNTYKDCDVQPKTFQTLNPHFITWRHLLVRLHANM